MRWRTQQNITTCSIIYDYVSGKPPVFQVTGFNCWNEILGLKYPIWQNSILLRQARSKPQYTSKKNCFNSLSGKDNSFLQAYNLRHFSHENTTSIMH
jgi:hypothetical protein